MSASKMLLTRMMRYPMFGVLQKVIGTAVAGRFRGDQPYNFPQIARQSSTSILNFPGDTLDETETRPETIEVSVHDFIIPAAALAFEPSYRLLKDRPTNHIPDEPQRNSRPGSTEIALRKR